MLFAIAQDQPPPEVAQTEDMGVRAIAVMGAYLVVLIGLGLLGRAKRKGESLRDFYLAGSSLGFVVLFLTLFATQYSGNTLLGFAGNAYRRGAAWLVSVTFMIVVISIMMIYAPRLYRLSNRFGYITPPDFVFHRFGSHALRVLATILFCWALFNYILTQLIAMGHASTAITGGRVSFNQGVILLAFVMLVYESLGGMRSVAWTDVVQGILLFAGCGVLLYILLTADGGLPAATAHVAATEPAKLAVPSAVGLRSWISSLVLFGMGIAIYPHAIQRIFAARSLPVLRRSMACMAFMPFLTTFLAFMIGFVGLRMFPGLTAAGETDQITIRVLRRLGQTDFTYWLVVIVFSAVVAAIMSTADSALLSIGSMFTKDVYKPYIRRRASPHHYLMVGKALGWLLMILLVWMACTNEDTILAWIRLKLEFMVQLSPLFLLGVYWRRLPTWAALTGVTTGTVITLGLWIGAMPKVGFFPTDAPWGISGGVWGLAVNYLICIFGGLLAWSLGPIERRAPARPV